MTAPHRPVELSRGWAGTAEEVAVERGTDPVGCLAERWARLAPGGGHPALVVQLATVLRRFGTVLRAEPFRALAARRIGADLLETSLCGRPEHAAEVEVEVEEVVAATLRLLRQEMPLALDAGGPAGERRVAEALDEMAAGLVGAVCRMAARSPAGLGAPPIRDRHLRGVYSHATLGIAVCDLEGLVLDLNPALRRTLGIAVPLPEPRPMSDFVHPDDLGDALERLARLVGGASDRVQLDLRLVGPESEALWVHATAFLVLDGAGEPSYVVAMVEDISQLHGAQPRVPSASYQDQLTRLPSRAVADQWLRWATLASGVARIGICAIDLDAFHRVNDALGHQMGDRLLLGVAGRLQLAGGDHLVARTGADEFVVLVADPTSPEEVTGLADRLQACLAVPFHIGGHVLDVTASIGVAEGPAAGTAARELVHAGDVALSWAKALGGNRRVVFDPAGDTAESRRFALVSGMGGAIARGEFRLVFQPLVRLRDGRVQGAEALVRWQHPDHGLLGPARFIQLAEYTGAIVPLGRWVLETACAQAASWWRELGADAPFVSVNVSPVQLAEPGWLREVTDVLAATGLPSHLLQLEITEQAVLGDVPAALEALGALRSAGVRLALDDFGTGYSSLSWLRRLPVHALKIDGSFIDGLRHPAADPTDSSIVQALVGMAHALGLEVTAEWVETDLQSERLVELGCDLGQGWRLGDAGPAEWVPELVRRSIDP